MRLSTIGTPGWMGPGFSIGGAGLALCAWTAERAGLTLPHWLLIPVGILAALMFAGGIAIVGRGFIASRRSVPQELKDEIRVIQRELIRLSNRREINGGSIWPIERPYRDLPTEQWETYGSRLRLADTDREALSNAYALAARFNDEMLAGETIIASEREPDLDGLRSAFDEVSTALGISAPPTAAEATGAISPKLAFGRARIPPEAQPVSSGAFNLPFYRPGRVIQVPVMNAQGASDAKSVHAELRFMPDDRDGQFSPRDPAQGEWVTDDGSPATRIDLPGNGQVHLLDIALVLNSGRPRIFEWTRRSREAKLHGYGVWSDAVDIEVEIKGGAPLAPSIIDTLHIEVTPGMIRADWKGAGPDEATNWVSLDGRQWPESA